LGLRLTLRSSGPPTAWRLGRAAVLFIIVHAAKAPHRWRPLNSRVRPHMRTTLLLAMLLALAGCAPYPLAYYSASDELPIRGGPCRVPHTRTIVVSEPQIDVTLDYYGSIVPQIQLSIRRAAIVRFLSSEVTLSSPDWPAARRIPVGYMHRPNWQDQGGFRPLSEFHGPIGVAIYSQLNEWAAPDEVAVQIPEFEIDGRLVQPPVTRFRLRRAWTAVGPCQ